MSTTTFRGYPIDILNGIKHFGRAIVGDDALYDAAQAYTDPAKGGGIFGPALTAADSSTPVDGPGQVTPDPATGALPVVVPQVTGVVIDDTIIEDPTDSPVDDDATPWDDVDWGVIRQLLKANKIQTPRTMGKATAIRLLIEHDIPVPS